ncbi:MAG: shikimate kinase [Acidobacteria bacterium]|nr:shikimate kinase [Acidobacteriota bacterium]
MNDSKRVALTGFMGVGKSSIARHLGSMLGCQIVDLDSEIERSTKRRIASIIDEDGLTAYRLIETETLRLALNQSRALIFSLGGGTWTSQQNRDLIRDHGITTVWLESTFEHCWYNIRTSKKERPLARDKKAARQLFEERQQIYCLADWHFIVRPGLNSQDLARQIADQVFYESSKPHLKKHTG